MRSAAPDASRNCGPPDAPRSLSRTVPPRVPACCIVALRDHDCVAGAFAALARA
jgi:hypothetical protein